MGPLVPAKAGTQFLAKHWIPAYAGMSGESRNGREMVDIPLSDFRKMAIEEFDTSKLLRHAAQQAAERGYDKFPIVDVDSHHYELESLDQILDFMDDPVLQQLARSATQSGG